MKIMGGIDSEFTGEAWAAEGVKVGYLPQEPQLNPDKTVIENVREGAGPVAQMVERFNAISAEMGDPQDDTDFDALMEEMGELQTKIDAVDGWSLDNQLEIAMERSEEHTSELQSLMRNSYAVFCLKKKKITYAHTIRCTK